MTNETILVEKQPNGAFNVTVKQSRMDLLKALFSGLLTINLDKTQAKLLSKDLYVPVKKVYKPRAAKPTAAAAE
jgi:hypothetical protein